MRYEAVFLDVDNTLLWIRVDAEGCVVDLLPYDATGSLTAEAATGLAWEILRRNIREHLEHRTKDDLAHFERRNIERTAREFGIFALSGLLMEVAKRRTSYVPFPESESVLRRLREMRIRP